MVKSKIFVKIFAGLSCFMLCFSTCSFAINEEYIWSTLDATTETSSNLGEVLEKQENTLGLESGSTILIEQTRKMV